VELHYQKGVLRETGHLTARTSRSYWEVVFLEQMAGDGAYQPFPLGFAKECLNHFDRIK
jgi:hypothetical protein